MVDNDQYVEIVEYQPKNSFRTFKKLFNYETEQFEDVVFLGIRRKDYPDALDWLQKKYGKSKYGQALWWETMDFVVMEEKIFTWFMIGR